MIKQGFSAEAHLAYLKKFSHTRKMVFRLGIEDTTQFVWLSWLECGCPSYSLSFDVINRTRQYLNRYSSRVSKEREYSENTFYNIPDNSESKYIQMLKDYYSQHTATETIRFFQLPDTRRVRKILSQVMPKPERKSGKTFGEKRKKVFTKFSYKELIEKGLPKATASRSAKRGYYYKPIN